MITTNFETEKNGDRRYELGRGKAGGPTAETLSFPKRFHFPRELFFLFTNESTISRGIKVENLADLSFISLLMLFLFGPLGWVRFNFSVVRRYPFRQRKILENRSLADEERMDALESQLKEARFLAEEADKKYDEVNNHLKKIECALPY